jgi:hypothetical protein
LSWPKDGDDRFLPLLGNHGHLHLALLDEIDGVRRVALPPNSMSNGIWTRKPFRNSHWK